VDNQDPGFRLRSRQLNAALPSLRAILAGSACIFSAALADLHGTEARSFLCLFPSIGLMGVAFTISENRD
jgi:hypothetical protein